MRIAYITSTYARASDTFIRNEVLALRRRGHQVFTYSIRRADADQDVSEEVKQEQASTDYILSHGALTLLWAVLTCTLAAPARMLAALRLAWQTRPDGLKAWLWQLIYVVEAAYVARQLQRQQVQVLHNHIAENSASVAMLAATLAGIPFSMTVHGPGIFFNARRWALAEKIHRSAFTVCITHFCKSQCMVFADAADFDKLHIVRCSISAEFRHVPALPIPLAPKLVCVGRLCPEKGMLLLVEAVARHVAAGGVCELSFIGDGPSRPQIEQLIARHGLQQSVRLLGWQSSAGVRREIEASRALVLPSFAEGLPIVIMEAMALSRPVISSRIAGIPELVRERDADAGNGWLAAAGAVDELVQAIAAATSLAPAELEAMGRRGYADVNRLHDLDTEIDKLERLLLAAAAPAVVPATAATAAGSLR